MLNQYLEKLKDQLKSHEKVKNDTILKSKKWTKSCYERLSKLIADFLLENYTDAQIRLRGTTISARTLNNIYKGVYKLSYPIDPRTLNTLSKIVFFLGHESWDNFVSSSNTIAEKKHKKKNNKEKIIALIESAAFAKFKSLHLLPKTDFKLLNSYYLEDGSALKEVKDTIKYHKKNNWGLSNSYNPSTYEIINLDILKKSKNRAYVKTLEYWLLCWWSLQEEKYIRRIKKIEDHHYVLIKNNEEWTIKTNAFQSDHYNSMDSDDQKALDNLNLRR